MTPRSFQDGSRSTDPAPQANGRLRLGGGSTVAVVLMGLGGPSGEADIAPYLERLIMDPARVRLRAVPRWLRERLARFLARRRAPGMAAALHAVGGTAPEIRLLGEQVRALETELGRCYGAEGVAFRGYTALRYGSEPPARLLARMQAAGVTHVILVPAAPVRLRALTDSCLAWWRAVTVAEGFDHVPTTALPAHGHQEGVMEALSDRVDEALQRFPRLLRDDVHLIFALHPAAALDAPDGAPEKTPLAPFVARLRAYRSEKRPCHYAYVQNWGLSRQPVPVLVEALDRVTAAGGTGAVVVPVGFTTETMETAYELDVVLRGLAEAHGLQQVEIAAALNCNGLYLRALATAIRDKVYLPGQGDGTVLPIPVPSRRLSARDGAV